MLYRYTYSEPEWCRFLGKRVTQLTVFEVQKMVPNHRPPNFGQMLEDYALHNVSLDKSCTWTYWDSVIPKWYEAWEEKYKTTRESGQLPEETKEADVQ